MSDLDALAAAMGRLTATVGNAYKRAELEPESQTYLFEVTQALDQWNAHVAQVARAPFTPPPVEIAGMPELISRTAKVIVELPSEPSERIYDSFVRIDLDLQRLHQVLSVLPPGMPAPIPPPPPPKPKHRRGAG